MKFDKSKVYTALDADELKVGSKIIVADNLSELRQLVAENTTPITLMSVRDEKCSTRFYCAGWSWNLAYLVEEPKEKKLKWTDLKVGDVITNGTSTVMVTRIDKISKYCGHIHAGGMWLIDDALEEWEKVEENDTEFNR